MGQTLSSSDWAKKEVLDKIQIATESSARSLAALSKLRDSGLDSLTQGAQAAGAATAGMAQSSKGFGNAVKNLRKSLTEATWQQEQAVSRARTLGNSLGAGQVNAGNMFQNFADKLSGAAAAMPVIGPIVGGLVGAITGVVTQLFQTRETFISLNQSGIMFGGSVARFNQAMGNAGLSSEQFAAIAQQSGQAIRIFGENRFLQTTTALRNTFLDLGLTIQQGNEYFAEYIENSRLMGSLYMSTREQEQAAFQKTIEQQQALAILTGASVAEQRKAARERAASVQTRAMMMALPPEEQARLREVSTALAGTGMDQKTIEALIMQQKFGRTSPELARMQSLMPREMADNLARFVQTGNAENQQAFIQTFAQQMQGLQGSPLMQTMALLATGSSLEGPIAALVNMITQLQASGNLTAEQRADLERLRERGRVMDEATRAIGTAQETVTRVLGMISAQINKLVTENVLDRFKDTIENIGNAVAAVSTAASGEGFRAFARAMGAGESGTTIAAAFDQGLLSGLSTLATEAFKGVINYFGTVLTNWGNQFLESLRNMLPSWLLRSAPARPDNTAGLADRARQPGQVVPAVPAASLATVPIPAPPVQAGQPDVLTPEVFAAIRSRENEVGRLAGELLNMSRRTEEQNTRLLQYQEEQNALQQRMLNAQVEGLGDVRREIIRLPERQ